MIDQERKRLWEQYKIWVSVSLETIDDSETSFVWTIKQYVIDGVEGTRKKDTWDFWKFTTSFSAERMMWYDCPDKALKEGINEANKLIK